jgi:hypothetical protein
MVKGGHDEMDFGSRYGSPVGPRCLVGSAADTASFSAADTASSDARYGADVDRPVRPGSVRLALTGLDGKRLSYRRIDKLAA